MRVFRKSHHWLGGAALCATAHIAAAQSVFLCKGPDGRQQYQDAPCAATSEIETKWTKDREKEKARRAQEAAINERMLEARKGSASLIKSCIADRDCTIESIRNAMLLLNRQELIAALGPPDNVQSAGYWYYTVIGEEAGAVRRVRLQVEFFYGQHPVTSKNEQLVWKVHVF